MADTYTIRKALDLASTAGAYLLPEVVDQSIRDFVSKEPVVYNIVNKVPWATNTYWIRKRTALPTAEWRPDGGPLPAVSDTAYGKVAKTVKYLYTRGEVTGPMQEAAGSVFNALASEVETHSASMIEKLSTDLVTATGASNDIQGMLYQISTDTSLNAGGGTLTKSGALTLAMIDEAIDATQGTADVMILSQPTRRKINSLLQAQQQFTDRTEVAAGFRVLTYDGLPMVTSPHWSSNADILFIRRADARLLVHKDLTFEELAKTRDSVDFMIKGYFGFALEGRPVRLTGFTATA
jgi:HK97 family phage major capsid protein